MKKEIRPPFLTTSFSQSGKKVKKRLSEIFDSRARRAGGIILAAAVVLCVLAGISVAVGYKAPLPKREEKTLAQRLYETRHSYVGDASANGETLRKLGISESIGPYKMELGTEKPPYSLHLSFDESFDESNIHRMNDYALLLMALIDNLDEVSWSYPSEDGTAFSKAEPTEGLKEKGKSEEGIAELLETLSYWETRNDSDEKQLREAETEEFSKNALIIDGDEVRNVGKLNEFFNLLVMHDSVKLDIVNWEQDGVYLKRIRSSENGFICHETNGEKDSNGEPKVISSKYYKYFRIFKDGKTAYFMLVDDESLTLREIQEYMLSSAITENPPEFKMLFFMEEGESYEEYIY